MNLKFWHRKEKDTLQRAKKGLVREWADALMFAVICATLMRWSTFEAYAIPSSSMEKSLLTGDFLFVSKLHYGSRIPITPVQVPLTHQTVWGTNIPSFSDIIQLPYFRLPGFSAVKHNDQVVFNHPQEAERPIDLKTNLVKRCIGVAGDTLEIKARQVYINGRAAKSPANLQYSYFLRTDNYINNHFFSDQDITDVYSVTGGYFIHTNPEKAAYLQSLNFVKEVKLLEALPGEAERGIFPQAPTTYAWNKDNFGPLYIPKAGETMVISAEKLPLYEKVLLTYEHNKDAQITNGKLYLDGKQVSSYTFKQNYYFMMGDNRHNSNDSRYWGFVPEEYLVGKAVSVWLSVDSTASLPNKIRWNRLFQAVN